MFHKKPYIAQYFSLEDCSEKDMVLVITDDASTYETYITQALSVVKNGLAELKDIEAPTNASALAAGVGLAFPHFTTMEEMAPLNDFFHKLGGNVAIKWAISCSISVKGENVIIVYTYNK